MDSRKYNEKDVTASLDGIAEAIKSGGLAPNVIADPYSNEATYSVGDYVTFNAKSYRCITAIDTPEEFDSEKWDEIKVLDELASAVELPPVTSTDNGKILKVTAGEWAKGDETKELPNTSYADTGKYLVSNGSGWVKSSKPIYYDEMSYDYASALLSHTFTDNHGYWPNLDNKCIDIYASKYGISPTSVTTTNAAGSTPSSITITFSAEDIPVGSGSVHVVVRIS